MADSKKYDLVISGVGSSGGGSYRTVNINGVGKITGDVDCEDFSLSGVGTFAGNVKTGEVKINGKGTIAGNLAAEKMTVNGHATIGGNLQGQEVRLEGMVTVKGSLVAESVENRGVTNITGDCNSEVFISQGAFDIGGLLNAGKVAISLYAPCKVREIGGEAIKVNMGRSFSIRKLIKAIFPVLAINTGLSCESIEGDEIYLENTRAQVVRGNNVIIGEGCEVQLVEYQGNYQKHEKAVVAAAKKLG